MTEEGEIQKAVFANLRSRAMPGAVYWHCPNGPEARRKAGYRAGVSDVHALYQSKFYSLELKIEDGGVVSDDQYKYADAVRGAGGYAYISEGLDDAISWLEINGVLRRAV